MCSGRAGSDRVGITYPGFLAKGSGGPGLGGGFLSGPTPLDPSQSLQSYIKSKPSQSNTSITCDFVSTGGSAVETRWKVESGPWLRCSLELSFAQIPLDITLAIQFLQVGFQLAVE